MKARLAWGGVVQPCEVEEFERDGMKCFRMHLDGLQPGEIGELQLRTTDLALLFPEGKAYSVQLLHAEPMTETYELRVLNEHSAPPFPEGK